MFKIIIYKFKNFLSLLSLKNISLKMFNQINLTYTVLMHKIFFKQRCSLLCDYVIMHIFQYIQYLHTFQIHDAYFQYCITQVLYVMVYAKLNESINQKYSNIQGKNMWFKHRPAFSFSRRKYSCRTYIIGSIETQICSCPTPDETNVTDPM